MTSAQNDLRRSAMSPPGISPTPPRPFRRCRPSPRAGWCTCWLGAGRGRHLPGEQGQSTPKVAIHVDGAPSTDESPLPETFVDYEDNPREYMLNSVSTMLDVHTRVSDLYSSPHDQIKEQLRLTIETIKEHQEGELINSPDYGLLSQVAPGADASRPSPARPPRTTWTPDHQGVEGAGLLPDPPRGRRRVRPRMHPPRRAATDGQPVRLAVPDLARPADDPVGQGAAGERQDQVPADPHRAAGRAWSACSSRGWPGEQGPGLSVRFMGIDRSAIASYLVSLYCSLAVLTDDALAVLDDVEVDQFHDYK